MTPCVRVRPAGHRPGRRRHGPDGALLADRHPGLDDVRERAHQPDRQRRHLSLRGLVGRPGPEPLAEGPHQRLRYAARYAPVTPGTQTVTLPPEADTYGAEASPNTTSGAVGGAARAPATPRLESDIYLRFIVNGFVGNVRSAKLRMFVTDGTGDGPQVFATTNAWDEQTLTWNNRPPPSGPALADVGAIDAGNWVEWDVPPSAITTGRSASCSRARRATRSGSTRASRSSSARAAARDHDGQRRLRPAAGRDADAPVARERLRRLPRAEPDARRAARVPVLRATRASPRPRSRSARRTRTAGPPNATGSVSYKAVAGSPRRPQDEADVRVIAQMTDVRRKHGPLRLHRRARAPDAASPDRQRERARRRTSRRPSRTSRSRDDALHRDRRHRDRRDLRPRHDPRRDHSPARCARARGGSGRCARPR